MKKELTLTIAAIGGAAILWALLGRDAAPHGGIDPAGAAPSSATPVEVDGLVDVVPSTDVPRATATWAVAVIDAKTREAIPGATIEGISKVGGLEASTGASMGALWMDVAPGDWTLNVKAQGYPNWTSSATIKSGQRTDTTVELDSTLRVSGLILSASGERMGYHEVLFLRPGQAKPAARPDVKKLPVKRADKRGRFELDLPGPGDWYPQVAFGGKALYVADTPSHLIHGGPSNAVITIPAATRLLVRVEDPALEGEPPVYGISLYRDPGNTPVHPAVRPQVASLPVDPSDLSDEERREMEAEKEHMANVFGDPDDPMTARRKAEHAAAQTLRSSVRPAGWVMAKSMRLRSDGTAEIPGVPPGEEFRAAIGRDGEAIRVNGPIVLREEQATLARIILPPAPPTGADAPKKLGTAELILEAIEPATPYSPTGVVWR